MNDTPDMIPKGIVIKSDLLKSYWAADSGHPAFLIHIRWFDEHAAASFAAAGTTANFGRFGLRSGNKIDIID